MKTMPTRLRGGALLYLISNAVDAVDSRNYTGLAE